MWTGLNLGLIVREVIAMVVVPVLLVLMWLQWKKRKPAAALRGGLALTASILLTAAWLTAATWDIPVNLHSEPLLGHLHFVELGYAVRIMQATGLLLTFAHLRLARIYATSSALLLFAWPLGYV